MHMRRSFAESNDATNVTGHHSLVHALLNMRKAENWEARVHRVTNHHFGSGIDSGTEKRKVFLNDSTPLGAGESLGSRKAIQAMTAKVPPTQQSNDPEMPLATRQASRRDSDTGDTDHGCLLSKQGAEVP